VIARLGLQALRELVTLGVAAIYVSAVALLMQRRLPRRLLMIFAPVGRMPLTTYLSQSLIATFIFYGWGLGWIGEVGVGGGIAIAAGIYAVQVAIAHLWLRRYRSGPMERLWRAIAYRAGSAPGGSRTAVVGEHAVGGPEPAPELERDRDRSGAEVDRRSRSGREQLEELRLPAPALVEELPPVRIGEIAEREP
jgi:hypothetical protein